MSLRTRVALAVGAVVFCVLGIVAAVVYPAVGAHLRGQDDEALMQVAEKVPVIAAKLKQGRVSVGQPVQLPGGKPVAEPVGHAVTGHAVPGHAVTGQPVKAPAGQSVAQLIPFGQMQLQILPDAAPGPTQGFVPATRQDVGVADGNDPPYFHDATYAGVAYRIYTAKFPDAPGVLVRVASPASAVTSAQTALGWLLIVLVPAGALGAAVIARLVAGRVLRPVGRLTETVERITATGDLGVPIETPGHDEVSRLGQAFAAMTAALDESAGAQRRLVADASHELRTPLTSLTTNLELLAEQPDDPSALALIASALTEAGELRALISDLVELARDGQASSHVEDVRLDLVAERVAARAASRAPELRYDLDCRPTLVRGDPDALERAIGNLVDNARKWSPPDGRVSISAAGGTVEISDEGPGISAGDLPYIFDRFYRSATARAQPGSGLGLAIVRRIAETHGGTVEAIPLPQGMRFRLSLPEIPADPPAGEQDPACG